MGRLFGHICEIDRYSRIVDESEKKASKNSIPKKSLIPPALSDTDSSEKMVETQKILDEPRMDSDENSR